MVEDSSASCDCCVFKVFQQLLIRGECATAGPYFLRDEKTPQIMCDEALPLDSTISAAAKTSPAGTKGTGGRRLVVKCPSIDDPVMRHIQLVLEMFPAHLS